MPMRSLDYRSGSVRLNDFDNKIKVSLIQKSVNRLEKFPNSGRQVPEIKRQDIREIIKGNYRIIYKIDDGAHMLRIYYLGPRRNVYEQFRHFLDYFQKTQRK